MGGNRIKSDIEDLRFTAGEAIEVIDRVRHEPDFHTDDLEEILANRAFFAARIAGEAA